MVKKNTRVAYRDKLALIFLMSFRIKSRNGLILGMIATIDHSLLSGIFLLSWAFGLQLLSVQTFQGLD
jgi:hypothetical protein